MGVLCEKLGLEREHRLRLRLHLLPQEGHLQVLPRVELARLDRFVVMIRLRIGEVGRDLIMGARCG